MRPPPTDSYLTLMDDVLIESDLWTMQPEILSAGLGFDGILGVPNGLLERAVRAAGGAWNDVTCSNGGQPPFAALTSSAIPSGIASVFGYETQYGDGLPVVFSWPVLPTTVQYSDFEVELNTGEVVVPDAVSISPNYEYNERNTVVLISAAFGERIPSDEAGAVYPVEVRIVQDSTPMQLVGPDGPVSAVGLSRASSNPYDGVGPFLVGAKLNLYSSGGESWPEGVGSQMPNDGETHYGDDAQYRLRVLTSGGFSPDGVRAVLPTEFARYFRIHATGADGENLLLTDTNVDYAVQGGVVHIVGLADLGVVEGGDDEIFFDDCYDEDSDNYIDIILKGDDAAMRSITNVEIPASGEYSPFYNPGGPGNDPTPGTVYTPPGPPDLEPVVMALDDPMVVTYP